jgi:hypothetical protein
MFTHKVTYVLALTVMLLSACSDSGDGPTGGGGGGGTTPVLTLTGGNMVVTEGQSATYTATLSGVATQDVTFTVTVSNLSSSAADYTFTSGSRTIDSGSTTLNVAVPVVDDATAESSELFAVAISGPAGATLGATVGGRVRIESSDGGADISFGSQVQPLLQANCGGCHANGTVNGGFNMGSSGVNAASIVSVVANHGPVVNIGSGNLSNMYLKTTDTPPFGDRMPFGGPYLSVANQNLIRSWINEGCQDN